MSLLCHESPYPVTEEMQIFMKRNILRLVILLGVLLQLFLFAAGWELFYPNVAGTLGSYTRWMLTGLYGVCLLALMRLYGAFQIGKVRVAQLVYSSVLSEVLAAALAYVVAVANSRAFFSPLPLVLILLCQAGVSVLLSYWCNRLYFSGYRRKKSVVIYRNEEDLEKIRAIDYFDDKFVVEGYICSPQTIEDILPKMEGFEAVFVSGIEATLRNGIVKRCIEDGILGYIYPHTGDVIMMNAEHMQMLSVPMVRIRRADPSLEYRFVKRLLDIVVSLVGILVTSPFMLVTAIAIKLYDGGPVLYKQVRLTKDGKRFKIWKFRSMRTDAERDGVARLASDNDERITPVGKVIRACRIDELPQLFNILKGDMSIVGPRPERPEIAAEYEKTLPAFKLRLQCKAGLTGYAQVYGRYNTEPKDKLKMDLMYIHNMGILEDLKICLYTVKILFVKDSTQGIAQGQTTAMETVEEKEKEAVVL